MNNDIFVQNPINLDLPRSVFNRDNQVKGSCNLGDLIPIYCDEVLPGDTCSMDLGSAIRMGTPIAPIYGNLYADVYFFFVPTRTIWEHWEQFNGANDVAAWTQNTEYTIPQSEFDPSKALVDIGNLGDYFGLPMFDANGEYLSAYDVNGLPLRAYWKIWNEWFRDENSIDPQLFTLGDSETSLHYEDSPAKVSRFHDLFSSCLPSPQKGPSISLPLGINAPIKAGSEFHALGDSLFDIKPIFGSYEVPDEQAESFSLEPVAISKEDGALYHSTDGVSPFVKDADGGITKTTLYADLQNATAATINQIRYAFQLQKLYEKDARGGTRYVELLRSHFGVTNGDARLQRAEYLCGKRVKIHVDQVITTAQTGDNDDIQNPVGQTGAYSLTNIKKSMFTKSFTEHGYLIGLMCIRQEHEYSQGLAKIWTKKNRFDFYLPVLANIGEVPVYKKELMFTGDASDNEVFGYQEPWYEYRYKQSRTCGYLNPNNPNSLDYWTLADKYASVPSLGKTFLEETPSFLDRALAVSSSVTHQFIYDIYFKEKWAREMPLHSVPGLIDHH